MSSRTLGGSAAWWRGACRGRRLKGLRSGLFLALLPKLPSGPAPTPPLPGRYVTLLLWLLPPCRGTVRGLRAPPAGLRALGSHSAPQGPPTLRPQTC